MQCCESGPMLVTARACASLYIGLVRLLLWSISGEGECPRFQSRSGCKLLSRTVMFCTVHSVALHSRTCSKPHCSVFVVLPGSCLHAPKTPRCFSIFPDHNFLFALLLLHNVRLVKHLLPPSKLQQLLRQNLLRVMFPCECCLISLPQVWRFTLLETSVASTTADNTRPIRVQNCFIHCYTESVHTSWSPLQVIECAAVPKPCLFVHPSICCVSSLESLLMAGGGGEGKSNMRAGETGGKSNMRCLAFAVDVCLCTCTHIV
jgi:hypothetical protein